MKFKKGDRVYFRVTYGKETYTGFGVVPINDWEVFVSPDDTDKFRDVIHGNWFFIRPERGDIVLLEAVYNSDLWKALE